MTDDLTSWHLTLATRDGTPFRARPMQPDDVEREREFIRSLSAESRFNRLMHVMREPSIEFLHQMVDVDYRHTMAFVGLIGVPPDEHFIAVARYAASSDSAEAEFAVAVADAWQGRGAGTQLAQVLFRYAQAQGLSRVFGDILATNLRMIELATHLGMRCKPHPEDSGLVRAVLDLNPAGYPHTR